jgi:hypothetical protein
MTVFKRPEAPLQVMKTRRIFRGVPLGGTKMAPEGIFKLLITNGVKLFSEKCDFAV